MRHHTPNEAGGTRTIPAETLVKNIALACVFDAPNTCTHAALARVIGTTANQIDHARTKAGEILDGTATITIAERNTRKDKVRVKAEPYIFDFANSDDYSKTDTKQNLVDVIEPRTGDIITVHRKIWHVTNAKQRHQLFLQSDHYTQFQNAHPGTIGYTVLSEVLSSVAKFVSNPLHESCVDQKMSGLDHFMAALTPLLKRPEVEEKLVRYDGNGMTHGDLYAITRKTSSHQMVCSVVCEKEEQPDLHFERTSHAQR